MVAKKLKIYDISDVSPTVTAGGDGMGSQVAPETEVGVFLKTLDPKLSTRYAKTLFDEFQARPHILIFNPAPHICILIYIYIYVYVYIKVGR